MKAKKPRCLRQQRDCTPDSDGEHIEETKAETQPAVVVGAIRELQKLRKRPAGISLAALNTGKEIQEMNLSFASDPFKLKTGGLISVDIKNGEEEENVEQRLAKTFATETNKRDEDAEMIKYIEEEVAKRKGLVEPSQSNKDTESDLLRDVPQHLRPAIGQQREDMLSNQMLCGIPEIDLGVEAKMKNIEATEEAKQVLLKQRYNHRTGLPVHGMAPVNMAVNFMQYNRWNNYTSVISDRADNENKRDLISLDAPQSPNNNCLARNENRRPDERCYLQSEKATDSKALQRFKNYIRDHRRR